MAGPVRRAGHKVGGHWPSPNDGKSDPQNTLKGQDEMPRDIAYGHTNEEAPPGVGKGNQPRPEAEKANTESIKRREGPRK